MTVLKLNARMAISLKLNAKMIILWFTVQRTSRPQPRYLLLLRRQPQLSLEGISSIDLKIHHTFNSNIRITHHFIKGFMTIIGYILNFHISNIRFIEKVRYPEEDDGNKV